MKRQVDKINKVIKNSEFRIKEFHCSWYVILELNSTWRNLKGAEFSIGTNGLSWSKDIDHLTVKELKIINKIFKIINR